MLSLLAYNYTLPTGMRFVAILYFVENQLHHLAAARSWLRPSLGLRSCPPVGRSRPVSCACRPYEPICMHERASARGNLLKRASWQVEIKQHRKVRESGSHVLSNLHLRSCLGPFFCILEQLGGNQLTYVCFATIRANLSRHAFHYHCQATALKSNCCCARLSRSFFTDNAFHEILFLQSRSHSEGSGS